VLCTASAWRRCAGRCERYAIRTAVLPLEKLIYVSDLISFLLITPEVLGKERLSKIGAEISYHLWQYAEPSWLSRNSNIRFIIYSLVLFVPSFLLTHYVFVAAPLLSAIWLIPLWVLLFILLGCIIMHKPLGRLSKPFVIITILAIYGIFIFYLITPTSALTVTALLGIAMRSLFLLLAFLSLCYLFVKLTALIISFLPHSPWMWDLDERFSLTLLTIGVLIFIFSRIIAIVYVGK
jgi:hypothetical protein